MTDIKDKDESKLERARQERLGGMFFLGNTEDGEVAWPEHWTDFEIEAYENLKRSFD